MPTNLLLSELSETTGSLSGQLPYMLMNDYIFRAILQESNTVLKGFICSLLHLTPEEVHSVVITNPIELGRAINLKTFIIDVHVSLNDSAVIHLEMQVLNKGYWTERSLGYLCRSFDQLNKGQDYSEAKPVIHISILNYTLFPSCPEFYSTYLLMNRKNHNIYSDKLMLSVLDLNQIALATNEDKKYQIDYWAALFKAQTWEELNMITSKNEYMKEICPTLYKVSADENIRLQCEALEDYYREQLTLQNEKDRMNREINTLKQKVDSARQEADSVKASLIEKDNLIAELQAQLAAQEKKS